MARRGAQERHRRLVGVGLQEAAQTRAVAAVAVLVDRVRVRHQPRRLAAALADPHIQPVHEQALVPDMGFVVVAVGTVEERAVELVLMRMSKKLA